MSCFIASFLSVKFELIRRIREFSSSVARDRASSLASISPNLFPCGDRVFMNAVLAAALNERRTGVMFSEDLDDLRLGEARLAHTESVSRPGKPTI